jgi:hypothetical protein
MSKERLTARAYYCKLNNVDIPRLNPEWNINDVFSFAEAFAAQEVEAAIAETKKQRDELLAALKEIALCKGAYSMDRLEHATNVIKEAKSIADTAIKNVEGKSEWDNLEDFNQPIDKPIVL